MNPTNRPRRVFLGTYFDRGRVLRLANVAVVLGWVILGVYVLEYAYNAYINVSGALLNGYPVDIAFLLLNLKGPLQGTMALVVLYAIAQVLLMLLDIEDNTREARAGKPEA